MLVVGNWKMNGNRVENVARLDCLAKGITEDLNVQAVVCVPFPYLAQTEQALQATPVGVGVQDVSTQSKGAYTGEVSAAMAAEFGCRYAIVGHSERRAYQFELSDAIALKAKQTVVHGLIPIVCVGETLEEREAGRTADVVTTQVSEILDRLTVEEQEQLVLAYEPIWAIGTGKSASGKEAQEVHACIRTLLRCRGNRLANTPLLYGGSVKAATASDIFSQADIDGALVGGASLDANEFIQICLSAGHAVARTICASAQND